MAAEFKKSLDKFKVPEAEQKELFDIVGPAATAAQTFSRTRCPPWWVPTMSNSSFCSASGLELVE